MNLESCLGKMNTAVKRLFFCSLYLTGVTNSPVQASHEVRIATAIFSTLSILNHSCCPNTSLVFSTSTTVKPSDPDLSEDRSSISKGVIVTVRAARDIAAGQEILHCYGESNSVSVLSVLQLSHCSISLFRSS